jgi:hypothetical protein
MDQKNSGGFAATAPPVPGDPLDLDDGEMIPLAQALYQAEGERLRRLVTSLLDEQGASERACPHCGRLIRCPDVVVLDKDSGRKKRVVVVLDAGTFLRHPKDCS